MNDNDINNLVWMNDNEINIPASKIIRNINLHILTNNELEEPYLKVYNCLKNMFNQKFKIYSDKYYIKEHKLYGLTKKKIYFSYDYKNHLIMLDSFNIFISFKGIAIRNDTIQELVTWYIKDMLNIGDSVNIRTIRASLNNVKRNIQCLKVVGKL